MTQAPRLRTSWSRIPSEYAANFCGADWHTYVDRGNGDYLLALAFKPSAHSESLKGAIAGLDDDMLTGTGEGQFRSPQALTMSVLGLIAEDAAIAPVVGGTVSKKKPGRRRPKVA